MFDVAALYRYLTCYREQIHYVPKGKENLFRNLSEEEPVARVPDEEVQRLKKEVDLAGLVERSGVVLKQTGADLVGCCPFHDDDTPSLVVTRSKGLWHCMGACQVGGSVVDWVMRSQGVSFRHAVEVLRAGDVPLVIAGGRRGPVVSVSSVRKLPSLLDASVDDRVLLGQVVDFYHQTLLSSPEAQEFLARRKIGDLEVVVRFRVGFSNRTLGYRLPVANRKAGGEIRGRLQRLGVLRGSGHEHFRGSIVFPVVTPVGDVAEVYGRRLRADGRSGQPPHLYLPGGHRGVWNEEGLDGGEVILCESLIDAMSFYCAGFTNVTAAYGTGGFTGDHLDAFETHGVCRVYIAYDHDPAGDTAATKLAGMLVGHGIECFRVVFPYGQDANDVAVEAADPRNALGGLIRRAEWIGGTPTSHQTDQADVVAIESGSVVDDSTDDQAEATADGPDGVVGVGSDEGGVPETVNPVFSSMAGSLASPSVTAGGVPVVVAGHGELVVDCGVRRWRVRHIPKALSPGSLRVNVMVSCGERFHLDTVDLYAAKARAGFVDAVVSELRVDRETVRAELGAVLLATEDTQAAATAPVVADPTAQMSSSEREAALELLGSSDLMGRVGDGFCTLGVVGERTAALTAWLALTSRLSDRPLGAVVQSSSSAGKSTLADAVLALIPCEQTVAYSAMTGQALYYLGEQDLAHKVLAVAEEEGASRASYALKLLVSEGKLSIAAAGKDPTSGRLVTHTYEVTGPVALLMTTTAAELEEELANRLLVLCVDEGRRQTRAVQDAQRHGETLDGLVARSKRADLIGLHQNAQRLLAPVAVVNPHAPSLSFSDRATRARRDNAKYLGLIRAVALAHQFQRPRKQVTVEGKTVSYIEATEADVAVVEELCGSVLDTTCDELSPITRRLLDTICGFTADRGSRFTRRELRETIGLGDSQLKVHLARLVDLEYLAVERAGPQTSYELVPDLQRDIEVDRPGRDGDRPVIGRSTRPTNTAVLSQLNDGVLDDGVLSAGIGRSTRPTDTIPFDQVTDPKTAREGDRPGLRQIRGTGPVSHEHVVVAEAAVGVGG